MYLCRLPPGWRYRVPNRSDPSTHGTRHFLSGGDLFCLGKDEIGPGYEESPKGTTCVDAQGDRFSIPNAKLPDGQQIRWPFGKTPIIELPRPRECFVTAAAEPLKR
jgi:hypothetical protein